MISCVRQSPALLLMVLLLCYAEIHAKSSFPKERAHCKQILGRLWDKQGGQKMPDLYLENIGEFGKPAEYDHHRQAIIIDPKAYELCIKVSDQKDEALAFLIAHELVHSYQHQSFSYESPGFFVKSQSLQSWAASRKHRRKQMETKADIWGAVLCYLAGYKVENSIPLFIEGLYDAFELKEEDPLYDSKSERMAIAHRAKDEVSKAIQIYEMALYLSLLQQHDKDTVLYQYLIADFKSAEFFNNLGLSYAKLALPMLDEPYRSYPYPFVLDTDTRLEKISKSQLSPQKLLLKSIQQFNQAIHLNPDYLANRINRACVFHILSGSARGNKSYYINQARSDIEYVQRYNPKVYPGSEQEILALHAYSKELLAIINQPAKFQNSQGRPQIETPACNVMSLEGIDLSKPYLMDRISYDWKLNVSFEKGIEIASKKLKGSQVLFYKSPEANASFSLQKVTKRIVNIPSSIYQVGTKIPDSARRNFRKSLSILQGYNYLIDDGMGVVYKLDPDQTVQEWAIYREL